MIRNTSSAYIYSLYNLRILCLHTLIFRRSLQKRRIVLRWIITKTVMLVRSFVPYQIHLVQILQSCIMFPWNTAQIEILNGTDKGLNNRRNKFKTFQEHKRYYSIVKCSTICKENSKTSVLWMLNVWKCCLNLTSFILKIILFSKYIGNKK